MAVKVKKNIGLIFSHLYDSYQENIWCGVSHTLKKNNYNLVCFAGGDLSSALDHSAQRNHLYSYVADSFLDGLIIISGVIGNCISRKEFIQFLHRFRDLPLINTGMLLKGFAGVVVNNRTGMLKLLHHLIIDHGYKNLAYITGPQENEDARARFAIYREVLAGHNIPFREELVVQGNFYSDSGYQAVGTLFGRNPPRINAIVCANDNMAYGVFQALTERGLRVPEDIALTGFDNHESACFSRVPFTTVHQPLFELGKISAQLIIKYIETGTVPDNIVLNTELIIRDSCGCKREQYRSVPQPYVNSFSTALTGNKSAPDINYIYYTAELMQYLDSTCTEIDTGEYYDSLGSILDLLSPSEIILDIFIRYLSEQLVVSINSTEDPHRKAVIEELYKCTIEITGKFMVKTISSKKLFKRKLEITIFRFNQAINAAHEWNQLKTTIRSNLQALGFHSYLIALFAEVPRRQVQPFLACSSGRRQIFKDQALYDPACLLNRFVKALPDNVHVQLLPLFMMEEILGFMVLEIRHNDGILYETIATVISSGINNLKLMSRVREYNQKLEQEVVRKTAHLNLEITERKRIEATSLQAEQEHKRKETFFLNLAHEMKTPLSLIGNYLDFYMQQHAPDHELQIIQQNFNKLKKDMVNFLDYEKLSQGRVFYDHTLVTDFASLLRLKLPLCETFAACKKISLKCNVRDNIKVRIDPAALNQVVNNLLENAIKYTPEEGKIEVTLDENSNAAIFKVKDNGIGMQKSQLPHIFAPYYQISHSKRNIQGIGMGLSIVKQIITQANGTIEVKSTHEQGAEFIVSLELAPADTAATVIGPDDTACEHNPAITPVLKKEQFDPDRKTIFLVEDNVQMLSHLQNHFIQYYNVFYAGNGKLALTKLSYIPRPDLIISDVMMDEMDGFEFYARLKARVQYKSIPIIFLTALYSEQKKLMALEQGVLDFIAKPFSIKELEARVVALLNHDSAQKTEHLQSFTNKLNEYIQTAQMRDCTEDYYILNKNCGQFNITEREKIVAVLLLQGLENKEIAVELNCALGTVKKHISNIFRKCNVQNRVELLNTLKFNN
ncbi:MAG: substrate-binding domain-containing protein [Spirochaetales bacterium]|nr:substrate-binding domain-containing protein [Spirochaetales bacterium]